MRKIAVFNQKGGVAKTTTSINLAAGLSRKERKVLLIDIDPQGDLSYCHNNRSTYNLHHYLKGYAELGECINNLGTNLDIIYTDEKITESEEEAAKQNNENFLFEKLSAIANYDYIIIDCPPSLRLITKGILLFADEVIIPASTDVLGYHALESTVKTILSLNKTHPHKALVSTILPTLYERRNKICKEILAKMKSEFTELLVASPIRLTTKLKEAPRAKKSIFNYDSKSTGAEDYWRFVDTILEHESLYNTNISHEKRLEMLREYYGKGEAAPDAKPAFGAKLIIKHTESLYEGNHKHTESHA